MRVLALCMAMLPLVGACAGGQFQIPGRKDRAGTSMKQERFVITPKSVKVPMGRSLSLKAEFSQADSLIPQFYWESLDSTFSVSPDGVLTPRFVGKGRACASLYYFYRPLPNGLRNNLRSGSMRPRCEIYQVVQAPK